MCAATNGASQAKRYCAGCGRELAPSDAFCPTCGRAVFSGAEQSAGSPATFEPSAETQARKKSKKGVVIAISALIAVVAVAVCGIFIYYNNVNKDEAKKEDEEYLDLTESTYETMQNDVDIAHDCAVLIIKVWENASLNSENFNTALDNLLSDAEFAAKTEEIKSHRDTVGEAMETLKNPKGKFKGLYNDLNKLYDSYLSITEMTFDPAADYIMSIDYLTFSKDFKSAYDKFAETAEAMEAYFD